MEILSPAGSFASMKAAVCSGADAVYFGADRFNARRNAENFSDEALPEQIRYCHERGVRCHGTLNTLVTQRELPRALETAEALIRAGVDALIIQDAGLASLLKQRTDLPLHASTQLTIHSLDGVLWAEQQGFSRVVLSREISRKDLEYIAARTPLELEIFVHGALCMCYSGQCYMSSFLGGRSGNRGECAQPCRLPYRGGYRLSLKDLCLLKYLPEFEQMGIASLKIEGRMKSPEYVSAVTSAYAAAKRGEVYSPETEAYLAGVFSRSGFTDGYYTESRGSEMFGVRSETVSRVEIPEKEYPRLGISVSFAPVGESLRCTIFCDGCTAEGEIPLQKAERRPVSEEDLRRAFGVLGNSPYYIDSFRATLPDDAFVPVSAVKALRRELIGRLTEMRLLGGHTFRSLPIPDAEKQPCTGRSEGVFLNPDTVPDGEKLDYIWLPLSAANRAEFFASRFPGKVGFVFPRIFSDSEQISVERLVSEWKKAGITDALCGTVGQIPFCFSHGLIPHGDFGLNIVNAASRDLFLSVGLRDVSLSFELNEAQLRDLTVPGTGITVYGRLPFMIFRNCLKKKHHEPEFLTDRIGKNFLLTCEFGCRNQLWNADCLWLADKDLSGLGFRRFLFTDESKRRVEEVLAAYRIGAAPEVGMTRGHFGK